MKKILVMNECFDCLNNLFDITYLTNDDMESTMEDLLKKNQKSNAEINPAQAFVYYSGLSELEMQQASLCLKNAGIQAIQVAQTPANLTWKLCDLMDEVKQEHEFFHTRQQLSNLIKQTMALPYNETKKDTIVQQLMNAMKAYSENQLVPMQEAIQSLVHLLSQENK